MIAYAGLVLRHLPSRSFGGSRGTLSLKGCLYTSERPRPRAAMPNYRCFFIDFKNHIANVAVAEHLDDGKAYAWAAELLARQDPVLYRAVEVWEADRIVCRHDRPVA